MGVHFKELIQHKCFELLIVYILLLLSIGSRGWPNSSRSDIVAENKVYLVCDLSTHIFKVVWLAFEFLDNEIGNFVKQFCDIHSLF